MEVPLTNSTDYVGQQPKQVDTKVSVCPAPSRIALSSSVAWWTTATCAAARLFYDVYVMMKPPPVLVHVFENVFAV